MEEDPGEFYRRKRETLWQLYWAENDGSDIYLPNGFREYPHEIYDLFCQQIDHGGKVLDLGCGNGLMLRHLVHHVGHRLIPYGVDFLAESIRQAREQVLPEYADNFTLGNILDYGYDDAPYDYIFFDPYDLNPADIPKVLSSILAALNPQGKLICYTYRDVLDAHGYGWVGEFPHLEELGLRQIDHPEVSLGIRKGK
jgi:SAM-dependent methyltransferase